MIRTTLAAMPHRATVLAAKAITLTGVVTAAGTVAVLGSLMAGLLILPGHGFTTAHGYPALQRLLQQIGPMSAGLAIQATTGLRNLPISPWAGLGVTAGWAAAALLAGGLLLRMRDA